MKMAIGNNWQFLQFLYNFTLISLLMKGYSRDYVVASVVYSNNDMANMDYGLVIDAGSSGSRLRIYTWEPRMGLHHIPHIQEIYEHKVRPGISDFVHKLDDLSAYIYKFLDKSMQYVPPEKHKNTPIYVLATAGMRLLLEPHANQVTVKIDQLLLNKTYNPFKYKAKLNTRILSGEEEGAFAWITTNYLTNFFNIPDQHSAGILEMGGASTQIAFRHSSSILADKFPVSIGGKFYPLYVHSYLTFGQDHLEERVKRKLYYLNDTATSVIDPCMLKGDSKHFAIDGKNIFFNGTGEPEACFDIIDSLVYKVENKNRCNPKPCAIGSVYQPTISNETFFALGAFYFPLKYVGAINSTDNTFSPSETLVAAFHYCSKHIDDLRYERSKNGNEKNYKFYSTDCMMGLYIPVLLVKGYGFSNTTRQLTAVQKIKGHSIEWPLGAMLYEIERGDWMCISPQALPSSGFLYHTAAIHVLVATLVLLYVLHY